MTAIDRHLPHATDPAAKPVVLFVSNRELQCGVHEFGTTIMKSIQNSDKYDFRYVEAAHTIEFAAELARHDPAAVIFNWHAITMPWAKAAAELVCDRPTIAILHDILSEHIGSMLDEPFDLFLVHEPNLQTTNPYVVPAPRPIPWFDAPPPDDRPAPTHGPVHIGSFGFPTRDKNFEQVIDYAQDAFDECVIHLHLPTASFSDGSADLAREVVADCMARVRRSGVVVRTSHNFLSRPELLAELAKNDLNILLYDADRGLGAISSAADMAVACGRPLALRRGKMFRHLDGATQPSIFVDDLPLAAIMRNGTTPLKTLRETWSPQRLTETYEHALDELLQRGTAVGSPACILVAGPFGEGEETGLEDLRAALAAATGSTVRAASVRSAPDLARRVREAGARAVAVDWRADALPWLNWAALGKLKVPVIALVRAAEMAPSHIPFTAVARYAQVSAEGLSEAARHLSEVLVDGADAIRRPLTAEQIAYVAAASHGLPETKIKGFDEQDLSALVNDLFRKGDDLWTAAHTLGASAADWERRAGELFSALEEMIKSRDYWQKVFDSYKPSFPGDNAPSAPTPARALDIVTSASPLLENSFVATGVFAKFRKAISRVWS